MGTYNFPCSHKNGYVAAGLGGVNSDWFPVSMQSNDSELNWETVEFVQVSLRSELYESDSLKNKGVVVVEKIDL